MALISCPECSKEISDKAINCPGCGMPINNKEAEEYLACPICRSKELHSEKAGFSGGKALAGAVLTGGIGILAGTIGSKDIYLTCLKCNHRFKAGQALIVKPLKFISNPELEARVVERYTQSENIVLTCELYAHETGCSFSDAVVPVAKILKENGIKSKEKQKSGCAGIMLLFVLITSILYIIV